MRPPHEITRPLFAAAVAALLPAGALAVPKVAKWSAATTAYQGAPFREALPACQDVVYRHGKSRANTILSPLIAASHRFDRSLPHTEGA